MIITQIFLELFEIFKNIFRLKHKQKYLYVFIALKKPIKIYSSIIYHKIFMIKFVYYIHYQTS